jgi:glutaryl-CoA dehydrogenase
MDTKVQPIINKYWSDDAFPFELLPSFKELGLGGLGYEGYGCAGGSQKLFGFVGMEMARVDASFCTFWGVHSGLAMGSIYLDGSEEQKQKWLPPMARWEKIGCFGLTEPLVGSGASRGLQTTAKREGDTWVLNGQKRWIGNAPWCDLTIIWARDLADNQVKGFIVENKSTPGFSVEKIEHKIALKVVQNRPDYAQGRSRAGSQPPAGRQFVPRHRARAAHDPLHGRLDVDRRADGCL